VAAICVSRPDQPFRHVLPLDELQRLDAARPQARVPLIVDAAYGEPFPGIQFSEPELLWNESVPVPESLELGLPATRTGIVIAANPRSRRSRRSTQTAALAPGSTDPIIVEPLLASGAIRRASGAKSFAPYYPVACRRSRRVVARRLQGPAVGSHGRQRAFFLFGCGFRGCGHEQELYARLKARGVLVCRGIISSRASRTRGHIATNACA